MWPDILQDVLSVERVIEVNTIGKQSKYHCQQTNGPLRKKKCISLKNYRN